MQLKIGLLEEQLGATADSARRRMEEQLDTFRGDAVTARWADTRCPALGAAFSVPVLTAIHCYIARQESTLRLSYSFRTLRTKFNELEHQLDAAQRAQRVEEEHSRHLAAQVERLQGRLKEGATKQAELSQQLW